jgi:hypothetical protein
VLHFTKLNIQEIFVNTLNLIDPELLSAEVEDSRYVNSPFRHLKQLHAKQKGKRYEKITECVVRKLGHTVSKPTNTDHDRVVDGIKVEIKGSTLNKNTDHFSFLQIRPDQDYEKIYFSMFYPDELVIMEMSKQKVLENISNGTFKKQHGGNKADSGTYLYYGNRESLVNIGATYVQ